MAGRRYPTAVHQCLEYLTGLTLAYVGLHSFGDLSTAALLGAVLVVAVAASSPGPLRWRSLLSSSQRRVGDATVGALCIAAAALRHDDLVDGLVLVLAGVLLVRLAASPPSPPSPRPTNGRTDDRGLDALLARAQPLINKGARSAGRAARGSRARRTSPAPRDEP